MKKQIQEILDSGVKTNSGASVYSVEGLPAESRAALHALNSREPGGFKENIKKMFDGVGRLIKRILGTFYVGYGHKSIGDCGSADIFCDSVSMLVANAFEHWPLFNGQETSSRYVDVTVNGFYIPEHLKGTVFEDWSRRWMDFYQRLQPVLLEIIREDNPFDSSGDKQVEQWRKATASRSFDIAGAFLPCGARTNFSEVMNLRQWSDQLQVLVHHPLEEVANTAQTVLDILKRDHPNSFRVSDREEKVRYSEMVAEHLFGGGNVPFDDYPDFLATSYGIPREVCNFVDLDLLQNRPVGSEIPFDLARLGGMYVSSLVDYRSFRDLHRHRSCVWVMPVVTPEYGFEEWYLEQLPEMFLIEARSLIQEYKKNWDDSDYDQLELQYCTPMGFKVPTEVYIPLTSFVYLPELRSKLAVHPTARRWAIRVGKAAQAIAPELNIQMDESPDGFCPDRGKHDIVKKEG